jgi:hypothetical protein
MGDQGFNPGVVELAGYTIARQGFLLIDWRAPTQTATH